MCIPTVCNIKEMKMFIIRMKSYNNNEIIYDDFGEFSRLVVLFFCGGKGVTFFFLLTTL